MQNKTEHFLYKNVVLLYIFCRTFASHVGLGIIKRLRKWF